MLWVVAITLSTHEPSASTRGATEPQGGKPNLPNLNGVSLWLVNKLNEPFELLENLALKRFR